MGIILIILWLYISIFCHEFGHFIVAKKAGFKPYLVIVGSGNKLLRFKWLDCVFEFRVFPSSGITYPSNLTLDNVKQKLALMYAAGPLVNFFFFLLFSIIYKSRYILNLEDSGYIDIIVFLILFELSCFVGCIVPMKVQVYGRQLDNDGKLLINVLTKTEQQYIQKHLGLGRYTNNKKSGADFFNNDLKVLQILYEANAEFSKRNFSRAIDLFEQILHYPGLAKRDKLYIIDTLASIVINYGELKYLDKADKWSAEAIALSSDIKTIQGTRGAILVELGRYSEGKEMLIPLTEDGNEAINISVSCCYIAKADYYLGNEDKVTYWLNKAEKIGASPMILQRIKKDINYL